MSRIISTAALFCFSVIFVQAQYAINLIPRISSDNSISERVGYTEIGIKYGSPKVRGRNIWGEVEEYGQIWRAGANKATTISFSEDVSIHGNKLSKGIYALFVIPEKDKEWTIIFNKEYDQWGAFGYKEEEDALRISVGPRFVNHVEDLTFDIVANGFESAKVSLAWERVKLNFKVDVEYLSLLNDRLQERVEKAPENTAWVVYLQGAEYLIDQGKKLDWAADWLEKSSTLFDPKGEWGVRYYPQEYVLGNLYWAKAKLAAAKGNYKLALKHTEEMKNLEGDYLFHEREEDSERISSRVKKWTASI